MTDLRKFFLWRLAIRERFIRPLHWAMCGTILLTLFIIANHRSAEAFSQKAIDQLLATKKCVRCDLREAGLAGKDLRSFKLMGAYLIGANLSAANLDRVRDLKQTQIDRVCGDPATVLPSGISISSCRDSVR